MGCGGAFLEVVPLVFVAATFTTIDKKRLPSLRNHFRQKWAVYLSSFFQNLPSTCGGVKNGGNCFDIVSLVQQVYLSI